MNLYDLHYHAFDLSHANLIAFLSRDDLISQEAIDVLMKKVPWYMKLAPAGVAQIPWVEKLIARKLRTVIHESGRIRSLLSVVENAIETHFLYIDYFLRNKAPFIGNPLQINPRHTIRVDKLILCPLLMDFGYRNMGKQSQFYNIPPGKPIVNQVVDLINAIYFYYHYEFSTVSGFDDRLKATEKEHDPSSRFMEIYPFLGINTVNYTFQQVERIFDKYFSDFENDTPVSRKQKLLQKMGTLHLDITEISEKKSALDPAERKDFNYIFAGIKLYPPLGFDPWPENGNERKKAELLYRKCLEKRIPVITHCSDGGFLTDINGRSYSNPSGHWNDVLTHPDFRNLKIDFAHFGNQSSGATEWKKVILGYFNTNPNVYSDISCCATKSDFYKTFKGYVAPSTQDRFLFGSDFLINMIWIDSYNHYLDLFLSDTNIDPGMKARIAHENAERFLFG